MMRPMLQKLLQRWMRGGDLKEEWSIEQEGGHESERETCEGEEVGNEGVNDQEDSPEYDEFAQPGIVATVKE